MKSNNDAREGIYDTQSDTRLDTASRRGDATSTSFQKEMEDVWHRDGHSQRSLGTVPRGFLCTPMTSTLREVSAP